MTVPATHPRHSARGASTPEARVGVVGAGPLARMLHEAAIPLGIEIRVLTDDLAAPAVLAGAVPVLGSAQDVDDLRALADGCDVVTVGDERVDPDALVDLGHTASVRPAPQATRLTQDKLVQRFMLVETGFPTLPFATLHCVEAIDAFAAHHGWPIVLRAQANGAERGSWTVDSPEAARSVWHEARRRELDLQAEAHHGSDRAFSVTVVRSLTGEVVTYPLVATAQGGDDGPQLASVDAALVHRATTVSAAIAGAFDVVGAMAVSCSVSASGEVVVGDLSLGPQDCARPTIEEGVMSPFEQHLRAILGWPLGRAGLDASSGTGADASGADPQTRRPRPGQAERASSPLAAPAPAPQRNSMRLLSGKRLLITGVVSEGSIAFATAARAQELGAEVLLTALDRDREHCEATAALLPDRADILPLDATRPADFDRLIDDLRQRWGRVDGALHAVAFAPRDALAGDFLAARPEGVNLAFQTSAYSYASLGRVLSALAPETGGALVGLDFDAAGAWPVYNWMGVCKAALESVNRYLARDLGPRLIRTNLVAAGPLHTRAASGIPDFRRLTEAWEARAPMPWDTRDPAPVADATCFLLSDLARAISGEILHVDGGYHAMAADLRGVAATDEPSDADRSMAIAGAPEPGRDVQPAARSTVA